MNEALFFSLNRFTRNRTLQALDKTDELVADEVPSGFSNSIRWNLGHILVTQEVLMFKNAANESMKLDSNLIELFKMGTKPDSKINYPTLEELRNLLAEQQERIERTFAGRLSELLGSPIKLGEWIEFKTIGEVLTFTIYHEGIHQGVINGIKYALKVPLK
jgi:uncharacterized damage-inducible protein DinB